MITPSPFISDPQLSSGFSLKAEQFLQHRVLPRGLFAHVGVGAGTNHIREPCHELWCMLLFSIIFYTHANPITLTAEFLVQRVQPSVMTGFWKGGGDCNTI